MRARTVAQRALLASLSIAALLTIVALMRVGTGVIGVKLTLTSWALMFASALSWASLAAWDTPGGRPWSRAGTAATLAALAGIVIGLWAEIQGETFWRLVATLIVVAAGGAHGALLSLARVAARLHTLRVLALANLALLVALICGELWIADRSGAVWATIGSLALLDVVFTPALAVLDHLRRTTLVDPNTVALPTAIAKDRR